MENDSLTLVSLGHHSHHSSSLFLSFLIIETGIQMIFSSKGCSKASVLSTQLLLGVLVLICEIQQALVLFQITCLDAMTQGNSLSNSNTRSRLSFKF